MKLPPLYLLFSILCLQVHSFTKGAPTASCGPGLPITSNGKQLLSPHPHYKHGALFVEVLDRATEQAVYTYTPGQIYIISLATTSNSDSYDFIGFIVGANPLNKPIQSGGEVYYTMDDGLGQNMSCPGRGTHITHTDNLGNASIHLRSLRATWVAPLYDVGDIYVQAGVVLNDRENLTSLASALLRSSLNNNPVLSLYQIHVHDIISAIAGFAVIIAVFVSFRLMLLHTSNWTNPREQWKIIGILFMVPVYAVDSLFSIMFPVSAVWIDLVRDSYEGYVIHLFLALMMEYVGKGNDTITCKRMSSLPDIRHPPPFRWIFPPFTKSIRLNKMFLDSCKLGTLQFAVLKPLGAFVAIILSLFGLYNPDKLSFHGSALYITVILGISVFVSGYTIIMFYFGLHSILASHNAMPKFICIKMVIFLSFWQTILLRILLSNNVVPNGTTYQASTIGTGVLNGLLIAEMMLISFAHNSAFSYEPYCTGHLTTRRSLPLPDDEIMIEVAPLSGKSPEQLVT